MEEFHRVLLLIVFISRSQQSSIRKEGTQTIHGIETWSLSSSVPAEGTKTEVSDVLKVTEVPEDLKDTEVPKDLKDTEVHEVSKDIEVPEVFKDIEVLEVLKDSEIPEDPNNTKVPEDLNDTEVLKVLKDEVPRATESAGFHRIECLEKDEDFYNRGITYEVEWVTLNPSTTFRIEGNDLISNAVDVGKDEGLYECKVTWPDRTVLTRKINLCVSPSSKSKIRPSLVSISADENALSQLESGSWYAPVDSTVEFFCQAHVGPQKCGLGNPYNISWSKIEDSSKVPVNASDNINMTTETIDEFTVGSGKIRIHSLRPSDYGTYECRISNQYGSVSANVTLTDEAPPNKDRNIWITLGFLIFLSFAPCMIYVMRHSIVELAFLYRRCKYDPWAEDQKYKYDVLIVHEPSSDKWVWNVLKPKLEEAFGYTCFFPVRDMQGGEYRHSYISEVVDQCQSVMIVVTPSLIEDEECLYTIIQASDVDRATTTLSKKMFPVILQPMKRKKRKNNFFIQQSNQNQQQVLGLLNQMSSVSISVPKSCKMEYLQTGDTGESHAETVKEKHDKVETKEMRLQGPITSGQHHQRVENMVIGSNSCSVLSKDSNFKNTQDEEIENFKKLSVKVDIGETYARSHTEKTLTQESETGDQELPDTPSSCAPFIFKENDSLETLSKRAFLRKWFRVLFAGDDEDLFWKKVRLRLPTERVLQKGAAVV